MQKSFFKKSNILILVMILMLVFGVSGIYLSLNRVKTTKQTQEESKITEKTDTKTRAESIEKSIEKPDEMKSSDKVVDKAVENKTTQNPFQYDIKKMSDGILSDCKDLNTGELSTKLELELFSKSLNKKYVVVGGSGTACAGNINRNWKLFEVSENGNYKQLTSEEASNGGVIILSPNQDKIIVTNGSHGGMCYDTKWFSVYNLNSGQRIYPLNSPIFSKSFSLNLDIPNKWTDNNSLEYTSNHFSDTECKADGFKLSETALSLKIN